MPDEMTVALVDRLAELFGGVACCHSPILK
jgi:hypothetical protein